MVMGWVTAGASVTDSPWEVRPRYEQVADVLMADDAVVTAAIEPHLPIPWTSLPGVWTPTSSRGARALGLVGDAGRPAGDVLGLAWPLADVAGRGADQPPGLLLLEDVGRPAGGARTREHRREHRRRDLGEVQDDGGPELHVGRQDAVGPAGVQLVERRLLEGGGRLVARGAEALAGRTQDAGARVLGTVDAVPEAHQALAPVEHALHVCRRVALLLDAVEHVQNARGRAAVQRPGHRADGARERRGDVGAG